MSGDGYHQGIPAWFAIYYLQAFGRKLLNPLCLYINLKRSMLAIRLPDAIESRLASLAYEPGRTKTALAREAIVEYIDDLEDYYLAEARARKSRKIIPLQDLENSFGLAD